MGNRLWPPNQIALNFASLLGQEGALLLGLDSFGDNGLRQRPPQPQNGMNDRGGLEIVTDLGDEGLVDLDLVEWKKAREQARPARILNARKSLKRIDIIGSGNRLDELLVTFHPHPLSHWLNRVLPRSGATDQAYRPAV
jgi:hypothetical protein